MKINKKLAIALVSMCLSSFGSIVAFADVNHDIGKEALKTVDGETYYISGKTDENSLNNISVSGGNVRIVLNNVDMNLSDWVEAISINSGANVNLILQGDNKITTGWGIIVTYGSNLNISGDGSLTVLARNSSAIGNVMYDSRGMGNINIQGGKLDLKSEYGCGIGAAIAKDGVGKVGDITISGGEIKAEGSEECAGIGSVNGSSLGNVYIGGDSKIEASSVHGAGIGTGTPDDKEVNSTTGTITIGGESSVKAVSYSGAGIGTGNNQDKSANISIDGKAKVYAESYEANSIGKGSNASAIPYVNIGKSSEVVMVSYKGDAVENPDGAVTEIKSTTAVISDTPLVLSGDTGKTVEVTVPKEAKSVAVNLKNGKIAGIDEEHTTSNGTVTKKEVNLNKNKRTEYVYVSVNGNDKNSGLTNITPVRSFEKAYSLVKNNGTIVICGGTIDINRVPKLGKNATIAVVDDNYSYNKFKPAVKISTDNNKIYDDIVIENVRCILDGKYNSAAFDKHIDIKTNNIVRNRSLLLSRIDTSAVAKKTGFIDSITSKFLV